MNDNGEYEPIASYRMRSDCSSAALVSRSGSIDRLCLPPLPETPI